MRNGARAGRPPRIIATTKPPGAVPARLVNRRADARVIILTRTRVSERG